jgi:hypothetical protein
MFFETPGGYKELNSNFSGLGFSEVLVSICQTWTLQPVLLFE